MSMVLISVQLAIITAQLGILAWVVAKAGRNGDS